MKEDAFARARSLSLVFEPSKTVLSVRQGFQLALKGQVVAPLDDTEPTLYDELWMEIVHSTVIAAYVHLATTLPTTMEHLRAACFYMPYGVNSPDGIDVTGNKEALSSVAMSITRITVNHEKTPFEVLLEDTENTSVCVEFKTGAGTVEKFEFGGSAVHHIWSRIIRLQHAVVESRPRIKIPGRFRRQQQVARDLRDEALFTGTGTETFAV